MKSHIEKDLKIIRNEVSESGSCISEVDEETEVLEIPDYMLNDDLVLSFDPNSPLRPKNWSFTKKVFHTLMYGIMTFAAQLNSTTLSTSKFPTVMSDEFGINRETSLLGTTLYILGIAIGPMIFAPISEVFGRKIGVIVPFFISSILTFVSSISYNLAGLFVSRFFAGCFAGAPIVSAGGVLADIWEPAQRGAAFAFYACVVANGASFGPTLSSLLMQSTTSGVSWRIPLWFVGLLELFMSVVGVVKLCESYEPVLLKSEAKYKRIVTQNWAIHCKADNLNLDLKTLARTQFIRPFLMLTTPIVFFMALFASYVYGIFYLFITTVSDVFTITREWEGTTATLPNISLFFGVLLGCFVNMWWANRYGRLITRKGLETIPEERLPLLIYIGWLMPAGIFFFGWTCYPSIHWIVPCLGIAMVGTSFITIFQGCLNYLVDAFTSYSASSIAANTFLRSIFAATFPLFSKQLFDTAGVHWGSSIIGFIALGMIPIPMIFYRYGKAIREKSPYFNPE